MTLTYDTAGLKPWVSDDALAAFDPSVALAEKMLSEGSGPGSDFLGWLRLPQAIDEAHLRAVGEKAAEMREISDILISIGIGGSYLGAKAAIEFVSPCFDELRSHRVLFAGHHINSDYLSDLLTCIEDAEVSVNVISKSGTTTEPGIAFRVIRTWLEKKYGREGAARRIVATTDSAKGALRKCADEQGYATFAIPDDVGGRFSVLTPVGLFPIAYAGIDIKALVEGAREAMPVCSGTSVADNLAARYAAARNVLFNQGRCIEVMAGLQPQLHYISEWWKQLSGESEGKNQTGIFPASVDYTTDLHSLGQWMQEGVRNAFETFLGFRTTQHTLEVPAMDDDGDGLNYLAGKTFEQINEQAFRGTLLAHNEGGIPAATLFIDERSPKSLGGLFYFFEKAIALSGYFLRVNPFNQPGVEAYKKNMFALLGKPGFEDRLAPLQSRFREMGL